MYSKNGENHNIFVCFPRSFAPIKGGLIRRRYMEEASDQTRKENVSIMNVHDVARYLRLSEAKVYRLANEGKVPSFRLGKSWRFRRDLIDEWTKKETLQILQEAG
jgi:excisionase family DNA binding protein